MGTTPNPDGFTDSPDLPSGRRARTVSEGLWSALADAAKRGVAKVKEAAPDVIDDLRKDLGAAAVRAKYEITQETVKVNETLHRLRFSAVAKPEAPADDKATAK